MTVRKKLQTPVGKVDITELSSLTDLGGQLTRINNATGDENISFGVDTGDYLMRGLIQGVESFQPSPIPDFTVLSLGVGESTTFNLTLVSEQRFIRNVFRINGGRGRFHIDTVDFEGGLLRKVNGDYDMDDIDFANAVGANNEVTIEYKNNLLKYSTGEVIVVTIYNTGNEPFLVRGFGTIPNFIPFFDTYFHEMTGIQSAPNCLESIADVSFDKLQLGYADGQGVEITGIPDPLLFPKMEKADRSNPLKRPAISAHFEGHDNRDICISGDTGFIRQVDTSMYTQGDRLYLGTSGDLTATIPDDYVQFIGTVVVVDDTGGIVSLNIDSPTTDVIEDTKTVIARTWSSQKIQDELDFKIDDAANVGGFVEVFRDEVVTTLNFRTLQSSDDTLSLTQNVDDIDIIHNNDYQFIESLNTVLTSNDFATNPVTKFDESLSLFGGRYQVTLTFEGGVSTTNRSLDLEFFIDNVLVDSTYSREPKDPNDVFLECKILTQVLTAGSHDFRVEFGKSGGIGAASVFVQNARVIVERKSNV